MNNLYDWLMNLINNIGSLNIFFTCILIMLDSIIPPLPLALFITILFTIYGPLIGFLISWISTIIGCILSFYLFQTVFKKFVDKRIRKYEFANKLLKIVDKMKFSNLVLLIAIPFTPAFAVNIVAGISEMNIKKFLPAIVLGKVFMIFFWGYIGTSLLESIKNPLILIKVLAMLLTAYLVSKIVNKKFKLD